MKQNPGQQASMLPSFLDAPKKEREKALKFFRHSQYRIGKTLFYQEDWADLVYFILSGRVRCIKWRSDESKFILNTVEKGQWLGLAEAISGGVYLCDTECITSVEVLILHQSHLPALLELNNFRRYMVASLARGYYTLHNTLSAPGSLELIARYLKRNFAKTNTIVVTQEEIAQAVGITRETVSKHLNHLQKEGTLTLNRGRIIINDLSSLENL